MAEDVTRRRGDVLKYSQEDLDRAKAEIRADERDRQRDNLIAELKGQINGLPAQMEATSRRVFAEMMTATRTENTNQRWRRADTLILLGQMATGMAAVAASIIISFGVH